jgi:hypothetical protein
MSAGTSRLIGVLLIMVGWYGAVASIACGICGVGFMRMLHIANLIALSVAGLGVVVVGAYLAGKE